MLRALRRLPAYALNGITVAAGIALVQAVCAMIHQSSVARMASTGAICASLPHVVGRARTIAPRSLAGGALGCVATAAIVSTAHAAPSLVGPVVALLVFPAMLTMAWGKRAGPISFAAILAIVFSLAASGQHGASEATAWTAVGAGIYALWAFASTRVLERRYRVLAVAEALGAMARLLRARAEVLVAADGSPWRWVKEEAALAELLQTARDVVFPGAHAMDRATAVLLRAIELRETLLASRLEIDRLPEATSRTLRARLADALRVAAASLDRADDALRTGAPLPAPVLPVLVLDDDPANPRLVSLAKDRIRHLGEDVAKIDQLLRGATPETMIAPTELQRFVDDERWPIRALRVNLSWDRPVFRHAIRTALALGSVVLLARFLPWAPHAYWLVLSVAVVLRGTLEQTLARRNARVFGTAFGCVLVVLMGRVLPEPAVRAGFFVAAGVAHAFVNVRYLLTATAATIMALLQIHLVTPATTIVVLERLGDTVVGALVAWAFSYVLPSWERRTLPRSVAAAVAALEDYARAALSNDADAALTQRLARQRAYDALEAVAIAVQRSAVEPLRVRPPVAELFAFVDQGQRLMAHLSSLRLLLRRPLHGLDDAAIAVALDDARAELHRRLSGDGHGAPVDDDVLPPEPPDRRGREWLLRRLRITVHDCAEVGRSARVALERLSSSGRA